MNPKSAFNQELRTMDVNKKIIVINSEAFMREIKDIFQSDIKELILSD